MTKTDVSPSPIPRKREAGRQLGLETTVGLAITAAALLYVTVYFSREVLRPLIVQPWKQSLETLASQLLVPWLLVSCLLQAYLGFSYLGRRDCVDHFHSLPISRSALFWGRYLRGLLWALLPMATALLLHGLLFAFSIHRQESLPLLYGNRLLTIVAVAALVYTLAVLVMVTGASLFHSACSLVILCITPVAMVYFLYYGIRWSIPGVATNVVRSFALSFLRLDYTTVPFLLCALALLGLLAGGMLLLTHTLFLHRASEGPGTLAQGLTRITCLVGALGGGCGAALALGFQLIPFVPSWFSLSPWAFYGVFLGAAALVYGLLWWVFAFTALPPIADKKECKNFRTKNALVFLTVPAFLLAFAGLLSTGMGLDVPQALLPSEGYLHVEGPGICSDSTVVKQGMVYPSIPITPENQEALTQLREAMTAYSRETQLPYFYGKNKDPQQSFFLEWQPQGTLDRPENQKITNYPLPAQTTPQALVLRKEIEAILHRLTRTEEYLSGVMPINALDMLEWVATQKNREDDSARSPSIRVREMAQPAQFLTLLEAALREDFKAGRYDPTLHYTPEDYILSYYPTRPFVAKGGTSAGKSAKGETYTMDPTYEFRIPSTMTATNALLRQVLPLTGEEVLP